MGFHRSKSDNYKLCYGQSEKLKKNLAVEFLILEQIMLDFIKRETGISNFISTADTTPAESSRKTTKKSALSDPQWSCFPVVQTKMSRQSH